MKKKSKMILTSALSTLAIITSCVSFSAVTYAIFESKRKINQPIGSMGLLGKEILLDPGLWNFDNPDYMMYVFKGDNVRWFKSEGKQSNGYYVFHVQDVSLYQGSESLDGYSYYMDVIFTRMDPSRPALTATELAAKTAAYFDEKYDNNSKYVCWNKTGDQRYRYTTGNGRNLCRITSWGNSWSGRGSIDNTTWEVFDTSVS